MRAALIGIFVAALASFLLWSYLKRFEDEASGGAKVSVLTVIKTVEPGTILKDNDIGERLIPQAYVEPRMIRGSDRQRVANLRVSVPLDAQQVLMWTDIVAGSDDRIPSSLVQPGMRAVTVHTDGKSSALVHPGDRVDVIATLPQPGSNEHRTGLVLLQNVLVLGRSAAGAGAISGSSNEGGDVALSLSLQDSQLLAVANDRAKLSLALRAPDDVRVQLGLAEITTAMLAEAEKRAVAAKAKTGPVPVGGGK